MKMDIFLVFGWTVLLVLVLLLLNGAANSPQIYREKQMGAVKTKLLSAFLN